MPALAQARSCKYCGQSGLYWKQYLTKYGKTAVRLFSPVTGQFHVCKEHPFQPIKPTPIVAEQVSPVEEPLIEEPVVEAITPIAPTPVKKVWDGHHKFFGKLLARVRCGLNILLVGPAGSGKTHAAHDVAKELDMGDRYYPLSVGPQTSKSDLIGYMDAQGRLVRTVLREAYENGGVFLLDEVDAGNPGVLTVLNALLANSVCSFPDGVVTKHQDFRCIAAANTYGHGSNRTYAGRQQLDGATLDRFVGIDWDYDERLEENLCGSQIDWCLYVWSLRKAADKLGIKRIFGTRRIQQGARMLDAGISLAEVKAETVFFGVPDDERSKLELNTR